MPQSMIKADQQSAQFWNGYVTRTEVQRVFDDYTKATVALQEKFIKLDFAVGFILEKFEVTPEQVSEFMKAKMEQFAAAEAAKQESKPAPKPTLVTEA